MVNRLTARLQPGVADQRGFALIESVFASVMLIVILGAVLGASESAQRIVPKDEALAFSVRDSQVALDRMTRELRQAYSLNGTPTATRMDVNVRLRGATTSNVTACPNPVCKRVVFDCAVAVPGAPGIESCVRWEVSLAGVAGPQQMIVPRVRTASFAYEPSAASPTYVRATLNVPAAGERKQGYTHDVLLDDGFYMRNLDNG
jgi:hypothetical protein